MKHIHFKTIDSTNTYIKKNYQSLDHMTIISTDHQSQGRGRQKKVWYGDEDSIMCSILLKEHIESMNFHLLPLMAAKSLHEILSKYLSDIKIKWPNDLLIHGLKLSGILVESIIQEHQIQAIVIGFGINVNQESFHDDIKGIATSLYQQTHKTYDKNHILNEIIIQVEKDLNLLSHDKKQIITYSNHHAALTNRLIQFEHDQKRLDGKVLSINQDGHLLVLVEDQIHTIHSGEIIIKKT